MRGIALSAPGGSVSCHGATQTDSGEAFVPPATETYTYDTDGNLATDGRWTYSWDGENRLVEMKRDTSVPTLSSRLRLRFEYDHLGRRIRKGFDTHNGTDWVEQTDTIFLYDGWNVMGELNANASNAKLRTYVWGLDLSGSLQGAGGVGGLLKVTDYVGGTTHHFVAYDGNGNVAALADGTTGALTARYEYGPFGEAIRTTGPGTTPMAEKNPFRFSTKYTDDQSGFLYYGYRFYNPSTGRWLSRDLVNELGSKALTRKRGRLHRSEERNLYAFVKNSPLALLDPSGNHPVEIFFPDSWKKSGEPTDGGWYAVHCAAHCWGHSLNKLLDCPLGKGAALEAIWTVGWELVELTSGEGGWGDEPWYDRLADVFANTVGAGLSESCVGDCQECESTWDLVKKAYKAMDCCDKACAGLQDAFMAFAHAMQRLTGEEWEE